jgi:UDP-N-acetylmuramoyl-L-alanyl-D-glutamate--2,6-diaminopimelate ligase
MRLKQLIEPIIGRHSYSCRDDFLVRGISCNSKNVSDNFIFVAIKGNRQDGNKFIQEAIDRGAKAIIVHRSPFTVHRKGKIPFIAVKDTRRALAKLAAEFYANPSAKIKVVGITGTNGKTTVTYLIEALLKEAHFSPAVIGTINYRFKEKIIPSRNTTPGPLELESMLADMLKEGVNYCLMEVSSHALDQDRTEGINFNSAIFTNLSQDHLDYHKTLKNYFQTKVKLFKDINPDAFVVINNDDKYGRRLRKLTKGKIVTYGIENNASVMAKDIEFDCKHTEFRLISPKGEVTFTSRLIGRHNVYNILATVAWGLEEGLKLSTIKSAIERFDFVPGRLQRVDFKGNFSVFIDYAHTEDALKNVITSLRQISKNRIIVLFGCGGERDKTKRPKMGKVVSELADFAIITNDNPRSEEPRDIIEDIKRGITKDNYCAIPDRWEAIKKSLSLARAGDMVLIAGKGHEQYQIIKDEMIHFEDEEAVRKCLKLMSY